MTSQSHVTTASLKQAHEEDNREVFFIRLNNMMYKFNHDQTNSQRVTNKRFGVEEWWSYINDFIHITHHNKLK